MIKSNTAVFHSIGTFFSIWTPPERKTILQPLIDFIKKVDKEQEIRLNFICTHNSRRSHLSQVWAQTAATLPCEKVFCYSGGTKHYYWNKQDSRCAPFWRYPVYSIKYGADAHPIIGFSKTYDDRFNPQSAFAAILTCSQADGACPFCWCWKESHHFWRPKSIW
jgi:arsenate reductase